MNSLFIYFVFRFSPYLLNNEYSHVMSCSVNRWYRDERIFFLSNPYRPLVHVIFLIQCLPFHYHTMNRSAIIVVHFCCFSILYTFKINFLSIACNHLLMASFLLPILTRRFANITLKHPHLPRFALLVPFLPF